MLKSAFHFVMVHPGAYEDKLVSCGNQQIEQTCANQHIEQTYKYKNAKVKH